MHRPTGTATHISDGLVNKSSKLKIDTNSSQQQQASNADNTVRQANNTKCRSAAILIQQAATHTEITHTEIQLCRNTYSQ